MAYKKRDGMCHLSENITTSFTKVFLLFCIWNVNLLYDAICHQDTTVSSLIQHWHQAITWTNVDLSSVRSSGIHLSAISTEIPQPSVTEISSKITYLNFHSNFPGANELIPTVFSSVHPVPLLCCPGRGGEGHHGENSWWQTQVRQGFQSVTT